MHCSYISLLSSFLLLSLSGILSSTAYATDYHVGPTQPYANIGDVRWDTLAAGDRVYIHWRSTPYYEKWVINRPGTSQDWIEVIGVDGPQGQQPVISGDNATTSPHVNFWNEPRGIIKIGGSNTPNNDIPSYIRIENLEIRSARPFYQFTNDGGGTENYSNNAASIYVEKAQHLVISNCTILDSGNGIFVGAFDGVTQDIRIEKNYIYDNGIVGRFLEHNTYTAAIGIIYEGNRFGPLRTGADGNNLKDRSAGLVVRYNWIEGGNRQLDLVDAEDSEVLVDHPDYNETHVYGNILIEPDGDGNSQIVHYGGDSGTQADYRKGTLQFYNNTVISLRSGNTTLVRLSTNDESAHVFNNVIYATAENKLALIDGTGTVNLENNWLKSGWKNCHCTPSGSINDLGNNLTGNDPLFENFNNDNFIPQNISPLVNNGMSIPSGLLPQFDVDEMYNKHQAMQTRTPFGNMDIGAFEVVSSNCTASTTFMHGSWDNGVPDGTKHAIIASNYSTSTYGNITACKCTIEQGVTVTVNSGDSITADEEFIVYGMLDQVLTAILEVQSP